MAILGPGKPIYIGTWTPLATGTIEIIEGFIEPFKQLI